MSTNAIEEVVKQINNVTDSKSKVDSEFAQLINKECCNSIKRFECTNHFLTSDLSSRILESLDDVSLEKKALAASLVAELGKHDTSRVFIGQPAIVNKLVPLLSSSSANTLLQACRALANISYEKGEELCGVLGDAGVNTILELLHNTVVPNRVENNPQVQAACIGLLVNLMADNETINKEVWAGGKVLPVMLQLLRSALSNKAALAVSHNIFVILVTLTASVPVHDIFTTEVCQLAVEMFSNSYDTEFVMTGLDFLEDAEVPDLVKVNLAKSGLFELFVTFMENKPAHVTEEEMKKYDLTGRVLANILTGDEAMEYLYQQDEARMLQHLVLWLSNDDSELVYAGVLCIGNIARTDKHSTEIVDKQVHLPLIEIIRDTNINMKMQHAVLSTLRNLSIPKCNKPRLIKSGLVPVLLSLLSLDVERASPVVFKLVGTLRQLVDGNEELAVELGTDERLVERLSWWAASPACPWVSSECARLLCWLIKISKDRRVMQTILAHDGYSQVVSMLRATHGLMQSECLTALTVTAAVALAEQGSDTHQDQGETSKPRLDNLDTVLVVNELGDKLKQLLTQHGARVDAHILDNAFTFLEVVTKFEEVSKHLKEHDLATVLCSKMAEREDCSRFTTRIDNIRNSI